MYPSRWQRPSVIWFGWILVAIFLTYGPQTFRSSLEQMTLDAVGQSLATIDLVYASAKETLSRPLSQTTLPAEQIVSNPESSNRLNQINQDLLARLALLEDENQRLRMIPRVPQEGKGPSTWQVSAISTNVLGRKAANSFSSEQLLISAGRTHGLSGQELVLEGEGWLIDLGEQAQLSPDQLVTLGRSLFGRVIQVGRWTSLIQPITDQEFRTAVVIYRPSELGFVTGPKGILKGTGTHCELVEVPGTEAVAVGDLVFTDLNVSPTQTPIYCGKVISTDIGTNDSQWTIAVEPANSGQLTPKSLNVMRIEMDNKGNSDLSY